MQQQYRDIEAALRGLPAGRHGARRVLLATHAEPDGDGLGSMLAFAQYLTAINIPYTVFSTHPIPAMYQYMPGVTTVTVGVKNISVSDYDVIIFFDISDVNRSLFSDRVKQQKDKTTVISIDHHPTTTTVDGVNIVDIAIIDTHAAATTALVRDYFAAADFPISQNVATCLLTGLVTDTGNFSNLSTTEDAIRLGAFFIRSGARLSRIVARTYQNKPLGQLRLWGRALERLKEDPETGMVTTALFRVDFDECGADDDAAEGISNFLNMLEGGKVICVYREKGNGEVKASLRTTASDGNVQEIAKRYGGGGHVKAAGYTLEGVLSEQPHRWEIVQKQERTGTIATH